MKKIILLIFLANTIIAQNVSYHTSEDFTDIKSKFDFGIFKFDNNLYGNVYYLKGDCFKIQTFDSTFNKVTQELTVALPEECKKAKNAIFKQYKNNFYCFYTTLQNKVGTLYALIFDAKTLKFSEESKKLFEVNDIQKGRFYGEFGYDTNSDSSLILVQYTKEFMSKGDFDHNFVTNGYVIFDNKLNKKFATEIQYPYTISDDCFTTSCSLFDKNGNIFILTPVKVNNSIDGKEITKDNTLRRLELLSLNKRNNVWEKKRINLDDNKYIGSPTIQEDLNGNILILGTYTNVNPIDLTLLGSSRIQSSDGIFTIQFELSVNGNILKNQSNLFEFPDNVIKMYEDKFRWNSMNKNGNYEFESLYLQDIYLKKDGSILFICESLDYASGISEDLILLKTNNNKIEWCHKIPKAQYTVANFKRYSHFNLKNDDYIFYLDDAENLTLTNEQKPHGYKPGENGSLLYAKIDNKGILTKSSLLETKIFKEKIFTSMFEKINENSIIIKSSDNITSKIFKIDVR